MITEDYVSFEVAKLLKEKGFDEIECNTCYKWNGNFCNNRRSMSGIDKEICYQAPTHQMALKWLREAHSKNIILDMVPLDEDSYVLWTFNVYCNKNYKIMWGTKQPKYNTYEDAIEAAIKYCLTNLI